MSKPCPDCGGHRWAAAGYCLEIECAGHIDDPDFPLSAPEEHKWNRAPVKKSGRKAAQKVKLPPKGTRRALELQYEAQGKVAPWLEKQNDTA